MSYEPTITIDGVELPGEWDGLSLVALDEVSIHWGREGLFDETEPATLTVYVIDPAGDWATNGDLIGTPITVDRATPTTRMFRGRIADVNVKPTTVYNPLTEKFERVWRTELLCTDPLTDLAQSITGGPGAPGGGVAIGVWPARSTPGARVTDLFTMGAGNIVTTIETPVPTPVPGQTAWVKSHPSTESISHLDLIRALYKYIPLAHADYDPTTHGIVLGLPADNDDLALVLDGGLMTLQPVSGVALPASSVIITDELAINSGVDSAIDAVQVNWRTYSPDTDVVAQTLTSRYDPAARGRRVLLIESDIYYIAQHAINVANATAAIVDEVNGLFSVPQGLRLDLRRFTYDDALIDIVLDTKTQPTAIYMAGSILAPLPNVGPMFQLIGATITWHNRAPGSTLPAGWTVDLQLAPTVGQVAGVGMQALVTNSTPTMADFDPALTMGELGYVTIGLS